MKCENVSSYIDDIYQNQGWLWFYYPFHCHCKVATVLNIYSPGLLVFTRNPVEFWTTDNQAGLWTISVADPLLLSCFHPSHHSSRLDVQALFWRQQVSVELLQEEKAVVRGGGKVKMDASHGNQLLLWAHWSPVVRATWWISPKQLSTRHLDTFCGAKHQECFQLFVESPLVVLCYSIIS